MLRYGSQDVTVCGPMSLFQSCLSSNGPMYVLHMLSQVIFTAV